MFKVLTAKKLEKLSNTKKCEYMRLIILGKCEWRG